MSALCNIQSRKSPGPESIQSLHLGRGAKRDTRLNENPGRPVPSVDHSSKSQAFLSAPDYCPTSYAALASVSAHRSVTNVEILLLDPAQQGPWGGSFLMFQLQRQSHCFGIFLKSGRRRAWLRPTPHRLAHRSLFGPGEDSSPIIILLVQRSLCGFNRAPVDACRPGGCRGRGRESWEQNMLNVRGSERTEFEPRSFSRGPR